MSGSISAKESNWVWIRRRRLRSSLIMRRFSDSIPMTPEPRAQWRRRGERAADLCSPYNEQESSCPSVLVSPLIYLSHRPTALCR
ncbi:hypothetical protein PVAP13_7NG381150 [Panicum virgatum]|uniref:Uncharacterized protein n=1 Tax=Panicum virgatum TaxID=38727 RepID=A0A8T0Q7I1_PANVG|nr:hypothetical protein PVAP13_7NG381150 [Panicum virgatum]